MMTSLAKLQASRHFCDGRSSKYLTKLQSRNPAGSACHSRDSRPSKYLTKLQPSSFRLHPFIGFSLVELLVVVALISILLGLLLPTLQRVKEEARRIACVSNIRQVGTTLMTYASDNEGSFPNGVDWRYFSYIDTSLNNISNYFGKASILVCPSTDSYYANGYKPGAFHGNFLVSRYAIYCGTGNHDPGPQVIDGWCNSSFSWTEASAARLPPATLYSFGTLRTSPAGYTCYVDVAEKQAIVLDMCAPNSTLGYTLPGFYIKNNHVRLNGENVLFGDGHAEWRNQNVLINRSIRGGFAATYW